MRVEPQALSIGELARRAGMKTSRVRYYEEIGLIPSAVRTASDQRIYTVSDLKLLTFIKRCRDFGFSLEQTRELAQLSTSATEECADVAEIAKIHLAEVKRKIAELKELSGALEGFVAECDAVCCGGPSRDCVVFDGISINDPDQTR